MEVHATTAPLSTTTSSQATGVIADYKETAELSTQDLQQIQQLKARDQVVRVHEAAHIAAGAGVVHGGAHFSFQRGPDGVQYAVGGEVSIDTSKVEGDPEATLQKAVQIQAAALAPSQPSSQDRTIAAKAAQLAVEARAEIAQQRNTNDREQQANDVTTATTPRQEAGQVLDIIV